MLENELPVMLTGEYHHQIDEKCRVRIPSKLKELLGSNPFITRGSDNCLFVYSQEEAKKVFFNKFKDNDFANSDKAKAIRMLTSGGFFAEEDKQGRILLPSHLLSHAKIEKGVVIIGVFNRAEIWSEENWTAYSNGAENNFNDNLKCIADE